MVISMKKFIKVLKNRRIRNFHGLWYADVTFYNLFLSCISIGNKIDLGVAQQPNITFSEFYEIFNLL